VEPQVQLHQPGHVLDDVLGEPQRGQPTPGHLRAFHLVVVERDASVGQQRPRPRLADVMQQRGQPDGQVAVQAVPRLQLDGLPQHGEAVLIDVLVPVVLVGFHPQLGHLGQDLAGDVGLDQHVDAERGVGRQHQLGQLAGNPLGGHDRKPVRLAGHGGAHLGRDGEPQLGREPGRSQDPQRVVAERLLGGPGGPQHLLPQRVEAAERIDELVSGQPGRHRVDGEIPAAQVLLERTAVLHIGSARAQPVLLAPVGGDLEDRVSLAQPDGAEGDPHRPYLVGPLAGYGQNLGRCRVRGQVEIAGLLAEEDIPDRSADQCELVAVAREQAADLGHGGHPLAQERGGRLPLFVAHGHGH